MYGLRAMPVIGSELLRVHPYLRAWEIGTGTPPDKETRHGQPAVRCVRSYHSSARRNPGIHDTRGMGMPDHQPTISPRRYARTGGVLYLYIIGAGIFVELFVRGKLVVSGDAAATASNILAHETLWRVAFSAEVLWLACAVALTMIFYVLMRVVNRNIAIMGAFFALMSIAVEAMSTLFHFAPALILGGASYLKVFDAQQLQALALLSISVFERGFGISLVFFGFEELCRGYLMFRSGFFPRFLGVLVIISGLSYLSNSFALFLSPKLSALVFPIFVITAGLPEMILAVWLIVVGLNATKWNERAAASASA